MKSVVAGTGFASLHRNFQKSNILSCIAQQKSDEKSHGFIFISANISGFRHLLPVWSFLWPDLTNEFM